MTSFQSHHIRNITFFGRRLAFGVVGGGSFRLPHDLFHSTLLYSIHFSSPVTICFKNGMFHYVSVENRMWKYGQEGFLRLTYVEPKHQSNSHNQAGANDFQPLIWIFWVFQLSPMWYNVGCCQLMSRFDRCQRQLVYPTVEHRPARNLQHETSQTTFDTFDQSRHLLCTLHKPFYAFQLRFYLSWNNKHNMPKMMLFFFRFQY